MTHPFIPLSMPNLKGNELSYLTEAIETEWVSTAGPYIARFEKMIADFVGVSEAVACQNGTAGLHLAMMECGVGAGDLVIVPTVTFIAAVNPVRYCGADPVFMDCDDGLCMDPQKLRRFCEEACELRDGSLYEKASGRRVRAVVPVHVFGNITDMESIMDIAAEYGLFVIEDATEALGSTFRSGRYSGRNAGTIGHIGVYSFNGNKIITTGGGGMIVAQDPQMLAHMRKLSIQAKKDEADHFYNHDEIGYNYRMTNIQAALGVAQAEQLPAFIEIKKRNYELFRELGVPLLSFSENVRPNYWFYSLMTGGRVPEVMDKLRAQNIDSRPIWMLIHRLPPYRNARAYEIERAPYYKDQVLNIPCSTNLTEENVRRIASAIMAILQ